MQSGDKCPFIDCTGRLIVGNSELQGTFQVQYLCCGACKRRPSNNKVVRPAADIRRRRFA